VRVSARGGTRYLEERKIVVSVDLKKDFSRKNGAGYFGEWILIETSNER
jgi:hypothetical protein